MVCIEPGLIKTSFGDAAVGSIAGDLDVEGPYAEFNQQVAAATAGAYESGLAKLGGGPDAVAKVIEKALRPQPPAALHGHGLGEARHDAARRSSATGCGTG